MDKNTFVEQLLLRAKESGLDTAEVLCTESERFSVRAQANDISDYQVSSSMGLGLRGTYKGKMGNASTQAMDEAAIEQLIEGVKESAELNESTEQDEIFAGEESYPEFADPESDLDNVSAEEKVDSVMKLYDATLKQDERIEQVMYSVVSTTKQTTMLRNSFGLNLSFTDRAWSAITTGIASREDGTKACDGYFAFGRNFASFDPDAIGKEAVARTLLKLDVAPATTGEYRVIFSNEAMCDMLATFCGMFSAENAQQGLSLLAGKEGQQVASDKVTLMDDPLLKGGFESCPFDAEGSASRTKAVIENGVLKTLLHNRKTARKQGVETTGNASRSYASGMTVSPTNMFFKPGESSLDEMMAEMGNGLVITDVSGLHAGANTISGDFSLISSGYTVENGKRGHCIEQITVAGNFYKLLKNVRAVGSDLQFPGSGIGCPSIDVGTLMISG